MDILDVGKSYQRHITVTNRATAGGQLATDTLLVGAQATLSGQIIQGFYGPAAIAPQIDFGPGQVVSIPLNFDIGWGDGDKQGQVVATVKALDGTLLKSGALDFYVRPRVKITFTYNNPVQSASRFAWQMPLYTGDNAFMYQGPTGKASNLMASILPYLVIAYYYTDPAKGWQQVIGDTILQQTEVVSTYVGYSMTLFVKVIQDVVWSIGQSLLVLNFSLTRENVGSEAANLWVMNYTLEQNGTIVVRKPLASGGDVYMSPGQVVTDTFGFDLTGLGSGYFDMRAQAIDRYLGYVGEVLFPQIVYVS